MFSRTNRIVLLASLTMLVSLAAAQAMESSISDKRLAETVAELASNRYLGRAPGSEGERLTIEYLTSRFEDLGYTPGNPDGTYVQAVPLMGLTVVNKPVLAVRTGDNSFSRLLEYGREYVGWSLYQRRHASVSDAEMVFVGYGVIAPEYNWNDYKDVDVTGKVVLMLVGDPPLEDESLFAGKAMTYYGRWTYKFETAGRMHAAGAVLVHNTEAAGYPWEVVENSWSGEQFDVVRDDAGLSRCAVESWITEPVAQDLFEAVGSSLLAAKEAALSMDFQPMPLGLRASTAIENRTRELTSHNVVARLPGNDERLSAEHIIYSAHWDHLGIGNAVDGDSIYNGAIDNASGVAGVLEIAEEFAARRTELKRSVLFLMTTAEESGLLGAVQYVSQPLYPLESTVANINVDGLNVWGRTEDMVVVGMGQSSLDDLLEEAATSLDRYIVPDSEPEKGYYYRSDHFPFAKAGVPALYADSGVEFRNRPHGWGMERRAEYVRERYHKPQDQYEGNWDLSGAVEDMRVLFLVGYKLAVSDIYPHWSQDSEFRLIREESLKRRQ